MLRQTSLGTIFMFMSLRNYGVTSRLLSGHKPVTNDSITQLPEIPKKPPTSYLLFVKDITAKFIAENGHMKRKDIVVKAAEMWKNLDFDSKNHYACEYEKANKIYIESLAEYHKNLTDEQRSLIAAIEEENKIKKKKKALKKALIKSGKPKRPLTAYLLYSISLQKDRPSDISLYDYANIVAKSWKELPESEKEKFELESQKLRSEYENEKAAWSVNIESDADIQKLVKAVKEQKVQMRENSLSDTSSESNFDTEDVLENKILKNNECTSNNNNNSEFPLPLCQTKQSSVKTKPTDNSLVKKVLDLFSFTKK